MIDEIQISSGSGNAILSKRDSLASRARFLIAFSLSRKSSGVMPKQYSIRSSSAGRYTLQFRPSSFGSYSTFEHSLRTFRIFLGTVRFGLSAPRQSISLRMYPLERSHVATRSSPYGRLQRPQYWESY